MSLKSKAPVVARTVLGAIFFTSGLNWFLNFMPAPPPTGRAADFFAGLHASGYLLPLLRSTELAAGFSLLAGRFVPLALTILAPVVVNIIAFHLFLAPETIPVPLAVVGLGLYLAWTERAAFSPLFRARGTRPAASREHPRDAAGVAA